jgi:Cu2+-exporting ATPase
MGSPLWCGLNDADHASAVESAGPRVHVADEQGWLATVFFNEAVREDAAQAVAALRALGITTWLLSGDRPDAAQRVARNVCVDHVVAQASPEEKLAHVQSLQDQGWRVAMVGDGLNDGPVLARANTAFALGHAAPLAQAQSDFVIQGGAIMDKTWGGRRRTTLCLCPWRCLAGCRLGWPALEWLRVLCG